MRNDAHPYTFPVSRSSRRKNRKRPKGRPRTRVQRVLLRFGWLLPIGAILIGTSILVLTYAFASIPLPKDVVLTSSAEVYDVHGRLIGTYSDEVTRFLIDTTKLPKYVGQAVVASEDRDFYKHDGVSFRGIIRAAWANLTGGEIQQGGSTITQQYVKIAVLEDPSRTISRKAKEAILSIKLERRHSKKEILGFYLNTIYLGRGAYGIEAAARTYFNKHADELTLSEAAYFAGIIPAPERYQPDGNQIGARDRRERTLRLMVEQGYISEARARRASRGRIKVSGESNSPKNQRAAYFMEWLRKEYLYPEYQGDLYTRGLKIYTTLDLELQDAAEDAIDAVLTEPNDPEAALVSMTPDGEVRAFIGGRDFTNVANARGFNYAADFPGRHAGSAFKPFTLLTAIEEGISPTSRFSGASPASIDNPACSGDEDGDGDLDPWQPTNYGDASYGTMTLDQGTTNSVNVVYAQLIAEVGPQKVADLVEEMGFAPKFGAEEISPDCSLALGTLDVTPVEMARAYAAVAGRGRLPDVMPIDYIEDSDGDCVKEYRDRRGRCGEEEDVATKQVIEANTADVAAEVLTHVVESGTATVADIGRPVAGKTGTTQDFGNAWFAGFVPQLATVVWEGYPIETIKAEPGTYIDERLVPKSGKIDVIPEMRYCSDVRLCRPVHGYEVTGGGTPVSPAVIWAAFMREATADLDPLPFPTPTDLPDEVINEAPPAPPPAPEQPESPTPEPTSEPTTKPTTEPTGEPTTEPTEPNPLPTETPNGDGGGPATLGVTFVALGATAAARRRKS